MADASVWSDRARQIGLFRYALIRTAADPALSARQRGRLVRAVAAAEHPGPDGRPVRVSRATVDRWVKAWSTGGFAALVPTPPRVSPRTPADVLDLALTIKQEEPDRTAAQVAEVLRVGFGWAPSPRTLQRLFLREGLPARGRAPALSYGRFEASRVNELWVGDHLHGPQVAGRKAYLFTVLDDHSAPRGALLYPRRSREELGGRFLGPMAYLDPKGEGNNSMPGKQRSCSGVRNDALRDPCDMAKARLPEPQSPGDASRRPPEKRPKPAPHPVSAKNGGRRNLRDVERCPMRAFKEMSGEPKSRYFV